MVATLVLSTALAHKAYWNPGSRGAADAYAIGFDPISSFYVGQLEPHEADFYRVDLPAETPLVFALLAPQACPSFSPELWLVARTLPEHEVAPFAVPKGFKALQIEGPWQLYRDYLVSARLGPRVRSDVGETGYYLAVYTGDVGGVYIGVQVGQHGFGGTDEGLRAVGDFHRCQTSASAPGR